jgi:putative spermidine/putrescine transport system permease protein
MTERSVIKRAVDSVAKGATYGALCVGIVFLTIPLLVTCLMAFDSRTYLGSLPPPALSFHWFTRLASQDNILSGLMVSIELAVVTTFISVIAGTAAAVAIAKRKVRGSSILAAFFLSPLIVPPVVLGFGLLLFLSKAGLPGGFVRLLIGHIIITIPYCVRTGLASLQGSDKSLTEAAMNLGATERRAFWTVTLPLMKTGIFTGAVFAFAISMDDVSVSLFLSDAASTTLPVTLVSNMRAAFDLTIAAAAVIMMATTVVLILILDRVVGFDRVIGQGLFRS